MPHQTNKPKQASPWDLLSSVFPWNWLKPSNIDDETSEESSQQNDDLPQLTKELNETPLKEIIKVNSTHPFIATPIIQLPRFESTHKKSPPTLKSSPNSIASSLLHKKKNGFSSIRKQQTKKQEQITKKMNSKYVAGFKTEKAKGFSGTIHDYESFVAYKKQVSEYQKDLGLETQPIIVPKIVEQTDQILKSDWLQDMKKTIDDIVRKPVAKIPKLDEANDTMYQKLLKKDEDIAKRVEQLKAKKKDLFPLLSEEDLAKVQKGMTGDPNRHWITFNNIPIHTKDLKTLHGNNWLNDEVTLLTDY